MKRVWLITAYWVAAALTFAGAVWLVFGWAPEERTMGIIQKVFYFHLPVAINAFLACTVVGVGGIGYLLARKPWWDDLAAAGAKVAVVLCSGVLLTGMMWARIAWGHWWDWQSPRLTFSLMLWLLYVVYLIVRASVEGARRRAVVCAVYGLIAYLDIPLVYLSARLIRDERHPGNIILAATSMKLTLAASFVPVTLLAAGLVVMQYQLHRRQRQERAEGSPETGEHANGGVT